MFRLRYEFIEGHQGLSSIFSYSNRPMLGPFTDTWDDLVNDNGDPLRFGMMHYTNATSTFCECVKPRDVKTALVLLNYLFLEHHTVENLLLVDSSMLLIKASSEGAGVHFNSIGKPNRMFAWFVIDYLSMCILFDTFIEHRSLVAIILCPRKTFLCS